MPIPQDLANISQEFHQTGPFGRECTDKRGPVRWRRNGATQRWKREPERFSIPVKWGLRSYGRITNYDAADFHAIEDCPLEAGVATCDVCGRSDDHQHTAEELAVR